MVIRALNIFSNSSRAMSLQISFQKNLWNFSLFKFLCVRSMLSFNLGRWRLRYIFSHYDVVILNAGVLMPSDHFTVDGIETTFQVNYLSHYLIVRSLIESRKRNSAEENRKSPLKVVTLTSVLYRFVASVVQEILFDQFHILISNSGFFFV